MLSRLVASAAQRATASAFTIRNLHATSILSAIEVKLRKGLDTVESLSAEASDNLSTNRNHLISTIVNWDQFGCSTAFV